MLVRDAHRQLRWLAIPAASTIPNHGRQFAATGHDHRICGLAVDKTFNVSAEFGSVLGSRGRFVFLSV